MNILQTLKKKGFFSTNWIYNKTVLYLIFVIALTNLFVLFQQEDIFSILFFLLVGFLTSFFSKNMVVILCICLFFTNVLKYGRSAAGHTEGFDSEKKEDEGEKKEDEGEKKEDEGEKKDNDKKKGDDKKKDNEKKDSEKKKDMNPEIKSESFDSANNDKKTDTDPMLLKQEKLLDNMNKYKSLLDTLQGITQNMKDLKGVSS